MLQVCIRVDSLNNILNEIDSFSKKLEKVNSTLAMFLCAKIMTMTILSHLLGFFLPWVNRRCFYWEKKILEQINIFFSNLVYSMYNSRFFIFRKIFSHHSNSSCQWKEFFFIMCHVRRQKNILHREKEKLLRWHFYLEKFL